MKKLFPILAVSLLIGACTPEPQPVEFGSDMCAHCKMTIVEKPFAAELVSKKGKVFKFDAIECMVHFFKENSEDQFALFLVRDLNNPEEWQDAKNCSYLISKQLPSPMGAFLSAYTTQESAQLMQQSKGGEVFGWERMKQQISR